MSPMAVRLRARARARRWHVIRIHGSDAAEQRDSKLILRSTLPWPFPGWPCRRYRPDSQLTLDLRPQQFAPTLALHRPNPTSPPPRPPIASTRLRQPPLAHLQQPQPLDECIRTRPFPQPHRPLLRPRVSRSTIGTHSPRLLLMLPAKPTRRIDGP